MNPESQHRPYLKTKARSYLKRLRKWANATHSQPQYGSEREYLDRVYRTKLGRPNVDQTYKKYSKRRSDATTSSLCERKILGAEDSPCLWTTLTPYDGEWAFDHRLSQFAKSVLKCVKKNNRYGHVKVWSMTVTVTSLLPVLKSALDKLHLRI